MPSPFPGMDPYIEASAYWGDFHTTFLTAVRAQLQRRLPRRYRANIDVYVTISDPGRGGRGTRRIEPDVFVSEGARESKSDDSGSAPPRSRVGRLICSSAEEEFRCGRRH